MDRIQFSRHARQRMFERRIQPADVLTAIREGKTIESRPEDKPYPCRLILGAAEGRALHVVYAEDRENRVGIVVTVYWPHEGRWESSFERRRR